MRPPNPMRIAARRALQGMPEQRGAEKLAIAMKNGRHEPGLAQRDTEIVATGAAAGPTTPPHTEARAERDDTDSDARNRTPRHGRTI